MSQHFLTFKIICDGHHVCEQGNGVLVFICVFMVGFPFDPHAHCLTALSPDESVQFCFIVVVYVFPFDVLVDFFLPDVLVEITFSLIQVTWPVRCAVEVDVFHGLDCGGDVGAMLEFRVDIFGDGFSCLDVLIRLPRVLAVVHEILELDAFAFESCLSGELSCLSLVPESS